MTENRDRIERAVELLVYAPIGAGLYLREVAPPIVETVVARGRAELDRRQADVQRHVTSARSLGQVALAFGLPKLRERVDGMLGRRPSAPPAARPAPVVTPRPPTVSHLSVAPDADCARERRAPDPRLRRALCVPGRRAPRGPRTRRARRRARVRSRTPAAAHHPRQDRTAGRLSAPVGERGGSSARSDRRGHPRDGRPRPRPAGRAARHARGGALGAPRRAGRTLRRGLSRLVGAG